MTIGYNPRHAVGLRTAATVFVDENRATPPSERYKFTADGVVTASPLQVEAINTKPSAVSSTFGGGCGVGCVGGIIGGVFGVCVILGCVVLRRAKKMPIKSPIKSAAA